MRVLSLLVVSLFVALALAEENPQFEVHRTRDGVLMYRAKKAVVVRGKVHRPMAIIFERASAEYEPIPLEAEFGKTLSELKSK